MNERICISKIFTYSAIFLLFITSLVVLSTLTLQSNQAKNSRAAEETNISAIPLPTAIPPNDSQQKNLNIQYSVTRGEDKLIELLGKPPKTNGEIYTLYMKKLDGSFIHIKTFPATPQAMRNKFSYWDPEMDISKDDIKNNTFYLYQAD